MQTKHSASVGTLFRHKCGKVNKGDLLFYIGLMIFPIAQFCVFYLGINFNSLLLTFQDIDVISNTTTYTLFGNLKEAFVRLTHESDLVTAFGQSLLAYFVPLVIGTSLALLFSYYIYKKMPMSKLFRVMLFVPSIISAIIMVVIFRFFAESAIPEFIKLFGGKKGQGLIENPNTRFGTIMFYNIWISFGVNCLMYVNAMNDIPPERVEAANLDGATGFREFWSISLPSIFSTLATFLVVGVAGIFTNQFNLFSFSGYTAPHGIMTYGYWLYRETLMTANSPAQVPVIAAMGVWMTVIAVPLTLLARWLLDKFGPSAE